VTAAGLLEVAGVGLWLAAGVVHEAEGRPFLGTALLLILAAAAVTALASPFVLAGTAFAGCAAGLARRGRWMGWVALAVALVEIVPLVIVFRVLVSVDR
jgi:hypothetical protein